MWKLEEGVAGIGICISPFFSGRGAASKAEPDHPPRDLQGDDLGGGQVRRRRPPVHRHGPALALRGRGHGRLHAQDHCGHLRGGPSGEQLMIQS